MVRMVAFQAHMRGDVLLSRGAEFEVTEEEAHAYAARKNPLAGPLDAADPEGPPRAAPVKRVVKKPAPLPRPKKKQLGRGRKDK